MTRYLKQRDMSSCGPIAIMNILKWAGIKEWKGLRPVERMLAKWRTEVSCYNGTWAKDLTRCLWAVKGIKVKHIHYRRPKLKHLDEWLDNGGALILRFFHDNPGFRVGHYVVVVGRTDKYYYVVNYARRRKVLSRLSRKVLANDLSKKRGIDKALTWFIARA